MLTLLTVLLWLFEAFRVVLILRILIDWIRALNPSYRPGKFIMFLAGVAYALTDWVVRPLGRLIRPIRLGGGYLDVSILVLFLVLWLLESLLVRILI